MLSYPQNQFKGFFGFFSLVINIKVLLKLHAWTTKTIFFKEIGKEK